MTRWRPVPHHDIPNTPRDSMICRSVSPPHLSDHLPQLLQVEIERLGGMFAHRHVWPLQNQVFNRIENARTERRTKSPHHEQTSLWETV